MVYWSHFIKPYMGYKEVCVCVWWELRDIQLNSLHSHLLLGAPINCPVLHSGVLCQSFNPGCNFHYSPHGVAPVTKEKEPAIATSRRMKACFSYKILHKSTLIFNYGIARDNISRMQSTLVLAS